MECKNYEPDPEESGEKFCENWRLRNDIGWSDGGGEPFEIEIEEDVFEELTRANCHKACRNLRPISISQDGGQNDR